MRIETTRSAAAVRLQHAAGFYGSDADLMAQLVRLADAALAAGEVVALALRPATERALVERLGSTRGLARLHQPASSHTACGQTAAARRAMELREIIGTTGGALTVLAEHSSHLDGVDGSFWTELDAAQDVALADLPVRVNCFFPEMPLHLEIIDGARRTHAFLRVGGELRPNPEHRGPREVLTARPVAPPVLLGPPDLQLEFSAWQLHEVRTAVEEALAAAAYEQERAEDVVLAVNEVATNAVEHGTPEARLSLWCGAEGLICEIDDGGTLRDPLPGLQVPHPAEARGRGVWIARQVCDSLHVWADARGTHVRMHATP
jgi:anti-sigma regulatory factor (Ser/Thr protein kinase)